MLNKHLDNFSAAVLWASGLRDTTAEEVTQRYPGRRLKSEATLDDKTGAMLTEVFPGRWVVEYEYRADLLAHKTPETHDKVMQKLGITPEEDRTWHKEHGGTPADWSKLEK